MKFLSIALLAMGLAPASTAKKLSSNELNHMVESGMIDKDRLLRKAVPVGRNLYGGYSQSNNGYTARSSSNNVSAFAFLDIEALPISHLDLPFSVRKRSIQY